MGFIISHALFVCCILAFYYAWDAFKKLDMQYMENFLLVLTCISSGIWSLGFYGITIQTSPDKAYYWRLFGMIGVFSFLIFSTMLTTYIAGIKKSIRRLIYGYASLGLILYFGLMQKDLVIYNELFFGMSYSFIPSIWNNLYTAYSIILAVIMTIAITWLLISSDKKRLKILAQKILLVIFIIIAGMIFDTILPALGITALPGSTYGQFIALVVLYQTIFFINKSRINISNISKFIYSSLDLPVLLFDSEQTLRLANNCADEFFEFRETNVQKYTIDKLFNTKSSLFDFEERRQEISAISKSNQTQCTLSINKVFDDFGDLLGYIVFVNDVTEHMKTIDRLEDAIAAADKANEAKSVFLANMSHEIRTPIHAIIGFSELVLKSNINDEVREYMEDIKLSSNNLLVTINDILDISKIESGKMELLPSNYYTSSLIKDVSLIVTTQAEQKGLNFNVDVDENLPTKMYGDKVRLRGVIINILNNAVKYTTKGSISFKARVSERKDNQAWLEFAISDTGIGIREEDIPNLFKKFERLDSDNNYNVEGSGLGLSIANGYIQLMGGQIKVESTYGEGSTFTIIVPQKIIDDTPFDKNYIYRKGNSEMTGHFRVNNIEVLVVDDNKINLRMAQGLFGSYGFKVDVADSGKKAIEICSKKCYPLVFMDQMMPNIDGIMAMKEIRKINPFYDYGKEGKIIVLTADAISGVRERLLNQGFDEYIGKPFDVKKLETLFLKYINDDNIVYEENSSSETDSENEKIIKELIDKLPQLNVSAGVSYCENNANEYLEILKIAIEYGEKRINELRKFQNNGDYQNYSILVHSLKSTAKNIGADEISEMAQQQELAGKSGNYSFIDDNYEELLQKYHNILSSISNVLDEYGIKVHTEALEEESNSDGLNASDLMTDEYVDSETIDFLLESILNYIEQFQFDSIFEILEELQECSLQDNDKQTFISIGQAMENLDVDTIRDIIASRMNPS